MKKSFIALAAVFLSQVSPAFSQEMLFVDDFNDGVISNDRYKIRTSNDNSTLIVDNGMLRLEAISDGAAPARAALDFVEQTDFIQAELKLDSNSMAEGNGISRVMLSGTLYNDNKPGGVEGGGSLGDVLVQLSLRLKGDGTLDNLVCAFRSDDADFGSITSIAIDGFTECGRFDVDIELGVPYTTSIFIDRENRKLVFTFNGSTLEHVIRGNIFEPTPTAVSSVLAQANGIGRAVAFADNVSNSFDPAAAADNSATEDPAVDTTEDAVVDTTEDPAVGTTEDPAVGTTEDPVVDTTDDPAVGTTEDPAVDTADDPAVGTTEDPAVDTTDAVIVNGVPSLGGSGSGCSIGGTSVSNDPMFPILATFALLVLGLRRTPLRRLLTKSIVTEKTAATV